MSDASSIPARIQPDRIAPPGPPPANGGAGVDGAIEPGHGGGVSEYMAELARLAREGKWSPLNPNATYAVQRDAREGLREVKGRDMADFFRAVMPSPRVRLWPGCGCWGCA